MSALLTISQICDRVLRKIGSYPTRSSGPRPDDVEEVRYWIDFVITHQLARQRTPWLMPQAATFPLVVGQSTYDLVQHLGGTQAPDGIAVVSSVILYDTATNQDIHTIPILRRLEFEHRNIPGGPRATDDSPWMWGTQPDRSLLPAETPGAPSVCYVSREHNPTIFLAPSPDSGRAYALRVVFQSYSTDFINAGLNERMLGLRATWFLWLITAVSAEVGNGPIRKLPADEVTNMQRESLRLRGELEQYDLHEKPNHRVDRVAFYDF